jgi:hypothetical chaperone protein
MSPVIGIDFGTTNSVVAVLRSDGSTETARFSADGAIQDMFRSVLCFWTDEVRAGGKLRHAAGPAAIESYIDDPLDSRLIMSMKSYLAQGSFSETRVFGRPFTLEALIALFLREFFAQAGIDPTEAHVVAGRPVRFAGEFANDSLGAGRLRAAYAAAGLPKVRFALEPEGAGYRFARTLDRAATVLIGDFGGGTSDFSVLRFAPGALRTVTPLGHAGVGIAGDVFDYRIIDNVISPLLGKGDVYTVMGKELPVPPEYFVHFARWHRLSLMRNPKTLREIREVARAAAHPERLRNLLTLIEDELGYQLYQVVSSVKAALSNAETARLQLRHKGLVVDRLVRRAEFEQWIAADLARLAETVDSALASSRTTPDDVDHVFLTGGTSFVPAVRKLFEARFGAEKVAAGGEFVSVAEGLALIGRDREAA